MLPNPFDPVYDPENNRQISLIADSLNNFDASHLSPINLNSLMKLEGLGMPVAQMVVGVGGLLAAAARTANEAELAEIQVRVSIIFWLHRLQTDAISNLTDAILAYNHAGQRHRLGVACVLLGLMNRTALFPVGMPDGAVQQTTWQAARRAFERCLEEAENEPNRSVRYPNNERVNFYRACLVNVAAEEALTPPIVAGWFKRYGYHPNLELELSLQQVETRLYNEAAAGNLDAVQRLAKLSEELAIKEQNPQVTAVMLGHAGTALLLCGDYAGAVHLLDQALALCSPRTHQKAVIAWLKALAEWRVPGKRTKAAVTARQAVEFFRELAEDATKKNHPSQKAWYESYAVGIAEAQRRLFALFLS